MIHISMIPRIFAQLNSQSGGAGETPSGMPAVFDPQWQWPTDLMGGLPIRWLVVIFLVAAIILAFRWWRQWYGQWVRWWQPWRVFLHLTACMGISWHARRLLIRIASHGQLASPLTLLMSRTTFDHYYGQYRAAHINDADSCDPLARHIESRAFGPVEPSPPTEATAG